MVNWKQLLSFNFHLVLTPGSEIQVNAKLVAPRVHFSKNYDQYLDKCGWIVCVQAKGRLPQQGARCDSCLLEIVGYPNRSWCALAPLRVGWTTVGQLRAATLTRSYLLANRLN